MYDAYGRGDLLYGDWLEKLSALYKERRLGTKETVAAALGNYKFVEGAENLAKYLRQKGYVLAVISGSFDILVRDVSNALDIRFQKANTRFVFGDDGYIEEMISEGDELHAKLRHLESFCDELGISINECVCIGDGGNDIEMFRKTQKGITFEDAPDDVKEVAWKVVSQLSDIKEVL